MVVEARLVGDPCLAKFTKCLCLVLLALLTAGAKKTQKTSSLTYGFVGPRIVKADKNAVRLHVLDVNGDKKCDLVYLKPGASEIVILLQNDKGGYDEKTLTPDRNIRRLCIGDLNGDTRPDIAFLEPEENVVAMLQGEKGKFDTELEFEVKATDLYAGDINEDGRDDLLAVSSKKLFLFYQSDKRKLEQPVKLANPCGAKWFLAVADIDGNGFKDILLRHPSSRAVLPIRFQTAKGVFGMEIQFKTEDQVPLRPFKVRPGEKRELLLSLRNLTQAAKIIELKHDKNDELALSLPRVFGFSNTSSKKSFAVADYNGDGRSDVLVIDSATAQMLFYPQGDSGLTGDFKAFPCLAGVSQIALIPGRKKNARAVIMASPEEKMLAVTELDDKGAFAFPTRISFSGTPSAVVALEPTKERVEIAVASSEKKGTKIFLLTRNATSAFEPGKEAIYESPEKLTHLDGVDANGDGVTDLLAFFRYTDPVLLLRAGDGSFKDMTKIKSFDRGLLTKLKPSAVSEADVDRDGRVELMMARKNFARALSVDSVKNQITVKEQYNGAEATSSIVRAELLDVDGDGTEEVLLFDAIKGALNISILAAGKNGIHKHKKTVALGAFNITDIVKADFNSDGRRDLLVMADDKMAAILSGVRDPKFGTTAMYKTAVEEGEYFSMYAGDVGGDKRSEILALERKEHHLEILSLDGAKLTQELSFPVFEKREDVFRSFFFRTSKMREPRQVVIADVDGDGRNDIIMLAHKNILIYRQKK